jgi:hypothetical protein
LSYYSTVWFVFIYIYSGKVQLFLSNSDEAKFVSVSIVGGNNCLKLLLFPSLICQEHVLPMIPTGGSFKEIITEGDGRISY